MQLFGEHFIARAVRLIMSKHISNDLISRRLRHIPQYLALLPVLWIIASFVIYPTVRTIGQSLANNGKQYIEFFDLSRTKNPNIIALFNSIDISLQSVLYCGILGTLLAFLIGRFDFPGKRIMNIAAVSPLILPSLVSVLAFIFLYGESGFITKGIQYLFHLDKVPFVLKGKTGILLVHLYTQYVYFYLNVSSALKGVDRSLEESARNLGANRIQVFFRITFPLLTPALVASSLLVFMTSMASFSAPLLLGGNFRLLSTQLYISKLNNNLPLAAVQAVVLSFFSILFLLILRWYEGKRSYSLSSKGVSTQVTEVRSPIGKIACIALGVIIEIVLILPLLVVVIISFVPEGTWTWQIYPTTFNFENYAKLFTNPRVFQPIYNSLKMAGLSTALDAIIGVAASYLIVKSKIRAKWLVDLLVMVPWALPSSVIAINLILAFNQPSIFSYNQILVGTFWILPIAYFIKHLPLVVRTSNAALSQFDDSLELAARGLGASWWHSFRKVVLPIILPGVMAGVLMAFVSACGEFTSSFMLYIFSNRPISVEIAAQMDQFNLGQACAYGVLQILLIFTVVAATNRITKADTVRIS